MPWREVIPVVNHSVRGLCRKPYPGHPGGCPNFGKAPRCPGQAPLIERALDLSHPVWAVWNVFPFGEHVARMRVKHPGWSEQQLACCLYWQGTARKQLREELVRFQRELGPLEVLTTPEACGVDITATMARVDVPLEWPPRTVAVQVALAGSLLAHEEWLW